MRRLSLLLLPALLAAQPPEDAAALRQKLAEVQGRLGQVDQQLAALKKRRKGILVDLQGISLQLDRARAQVDQARLRRDQAQGEAQGIQGEQARLRAELQGLRGALRQQVRWMQAVGPLGDLGFFATFRDLEAWLERGRMLTWVQVQERRRLARIQELQRELGKKAQALGEAMSRLASEEREASQLQAGLKVQEDRLAAFLEGVQKDEAAKKRVQAELAEEAVQLERLLTGLLSRPAAGPFEPAVAFASLRGGLPQPVDGTLAQGFGEHLHPVFHTRTVQTGILVAAPAGRPVKAVAEGRVAFSEAYQSYGPMVILDHGGGWFTLYTHLQALSVARGQVLAAGEVLGSVGDTADGPRLGFEVRQKSQPQDPQKWLKARYR